MASVRNRAGTAAGRVWLTLYVVMTMLGGSFVFSQATPGTGPEVVELRIRGNSAVPVEKIVPSIRTRSGRPFDPTVMEEDVRRLYQTRKFVKVQPIVEDAPGGKIVIFEVLERPTLGYIKYTGNEKVKKKTLAKETGLKAGDPMDPYAVEEGRRKLVEYYHSKGFSKVYIEIAEGAKSNDRGAVYVINEGPKQKILWTQFVGNSIATDSRLRTQIKSKPGILWIFKGEVDRKQIDEDINRLTAYYKSIGFLDVQVGHLLEFNEAQDWLTLTFAINEGPRYQIREVRVLGNKLFSREQLAEDMKLNAGEYFHQSDMLSDAASMQDVYGGEGYVFSEVKPELRYLEEPAKVDLVYNIKESPRYRVGKINVQIGGDTPHTKITTVLNRMSLRPGDIVDTRELRASERRLKASGLFRVDPAMGVSPKIVFNRPETEDETDMADQPRRPRSFRGQSPDEEPNRLVDVTIEGEWLDPEQAAEQANPAQTPSAVPSADEAQRAHNDSAGPVSEPPENQGALDCRPSQPIIRGQSPDDPPARPLDTSGWNSARSDVTVPQAAPPVAAQASPPRAATNSTPLRWGSPAPQPAYSGTTDLSRRMAAIASTRRPELVRGQNTYDGNDGYAVPPLPSAAPPQAVPQFTPPANGGQAPAAAAFGDPTGPLPGAQFNQPAFNDMSRPGNVVAPPDPATPAMFAEPPLLTDPSSLLGRPPHEEPPLYLPLIPELEETQTGRLMLSVGVNSELGLVGSLVVDEQNFDITRLPRSWDEMISGRAFRGAGQRFRMELMPGTSVQRYTVNWTEPYLFERPISLGVSGHYYQRSYFEWFESRAGGRIALGRQLGTPDLMASIAYRGEDVRIQDPIIPTPAELTEALGHNTVHGFRGAITLDKRDNAFLATEGFMAEAGVEQVIGSFNYPRADFEFRKYFMLHERPDRSGRHVLCLGSRAAVTADNTPIYDRYFIGGFSTMRGFDFRGASPRDPATGVTVGGNFMLLNSLEYLFPITADDMLRGVVFVDTGAVQPTIDNWRDRYRVAPGFGLRISLPAMGPAPIALDFAFPVVKEPGDDTQVFSFFIGFLR